MLWNQGSNTAAGRNCRVAPISNERMAVLVNRIKYSSDAHRFSKQLLLWTLARTGNLERRVALSVWDTFYPLKASLIQADIEAMMCSDHRTKLYEFFHVAGTEVGISHHCGRLHGGKFKQNEHEWFTLWVSLFRFDEGAEVLVPPTWEEVSAIQL